MAGPEESRRGPLGWCGWPIIWMRSLAPPREHALDLIRERADPDATDALAATLEITARQLRACRPGLTVVESRARGADNSRILPTRWPCDEADSGSHAPVAPPMSGTA